MRCGTRAVPPRSWRDTGWKGKRMQQPVKLHKGGCLCGEVRYSVAEAPLYSGICHCRTCRRIASATTLPYVVFPARTFVFASGTPRRFASSANVIRTFCGSCGSPLTYQAITEPDTIDIMTISLDDPEAYRPLAHVWVSAKVGWDVIGDDLPQYQEGRPVDDQTPSSS